VDNPIVTSLRGIQQASGLKKVQRELGCPRASLRSLSEASSIFDSQSLKEIIAELGDQLQPLAHDKRLDEIHQTITLVDGSVIAALPRIMEASWRKRQRYSIKNRISSRVVVPRRAMPRVAAQVLAQFVHLVQAIRVLGVT
jgi:hypothetical protein